MFEHLWSVLLAWALSLCPYCHITGFATSRQLVLDTCSVYCLTLSKTIVSTKCALAFGLAFFAFDFARSPTDAKPPDTSLRGRCVCRHARPARVYSPRPSGRSCICKMSCTSSRFSSPLPCGLLAWSKSSSATWSNAFVANLLFRCSCSSSDLTKLPSWLLNLVLRHCVQYVLSCLTVFRCLLSAQLIIIC